MNEQISQKQKTKEYDMVMDSGFEFECFQRDKAVAQDKKQLASHLSEQKRDQQNQRTYDSLQQKGARNDVNDEGERQRIKDQEFMRKKA